MEKGKLTWSKADKAGHESPGEDCGLPHQTVGVNRRFQVCTTDAVFVVRQLREYLATKKRFYMAFIDLEEAFDGVPRKVIRWALRKLGVDCATCRGCMPMSRALSVFVSGTVKSLK